MLFSIGNIKPLFQAVFPTCWDTKDVCNPQWLNAIEYLEIVGIIVGQVLVGIVGDWYVLLIIYFLFFIFVRALTTLGLVDVLVSSKMRLSCLSVC